jgi:hypothetical protein
MALLLGKYENIVYSKQNECSSSRYTNSNCFGYSKKTGTVTSFSKNGTGQALMGSCL